MDKWKVLPTDERYLQLSPEQKVLLLTMEETLPTREEVLIQFRNQLQGKVEIKEADRKAAEKLGLDLDAAIASLDGSRTQSTKTLGETTEVPVDVPLARAFPRKRAPMRRRIRRR